jgi:hypothetical protein
MPKGKGFLRSRSLRLRFLARLADARRPYPLQGHAMWSTWESLKNSQALQRLTIRSTFYVSDFLRQRPMLSFKEPTTLIHAAMDTIYSA